MPGWKTWAALEEVTAANMNSYVRDQTIQVFNNAASRTAAIGTPTRGLVSLLTDTGAVEIYYGATTGWFRPWNMALGLVAAPITSTSAQTFSSTTPTDVTGMTQTFSATANRVYKLTYQGLFDSPAGAPTIGALRFFNTTTSTQLNQGNYFFTTSGDAGTAHIVHYYTAPTTASVSIKVQGFVAVAGDQFRTLFGATSPSLFAIEDVGPSTFTAPVA